MTTIPSNSATATAESSAAWKAFQPQVTINSVTIASPPVVKFTVKDADGKPVVGLGSTNQSATATVASRTNLSFSLAKLVPGTNNAPSQWVSYLVVRPVTVAEKAGTVAATASCNSTTAPTWCGTFPTSDSQGTLVDNGDGSYVYTFYRDIKQAATIAASLIDTADGLSKKADLGDLTYDPTLTHRLGVIISGAAPGTSSNTPTGVTVTPAVNIETPGNFTYDFRPDGGAITSTRDIVKIDSCNECHVGKGLAHGASRKDPKLCVTCHTPQIIYSFNKEAPRTGLVLTGGLTGTTQQKRADQAIIYGRSVGQFPSLVHKVHMGDELLIQGYNFNVDGGAMMFNEVKYPQPRTNCVKCHDGSATAKNKTADGDNWKNVPSRLACGACHDGIDFATGKGTRLEGDTLGHIGGAKADDKQCVLCHDAVTIPTYHVTVDPKGSNGFGGYPLGAPGYTASTGPSIPVASQLGNLPTGLYKISFEIKQVTVTGASGAKKINVTYRTLKDGTPVTFNSTGNLIDNVAGSPSIMVTYAIPQDGIAAPSDWNYQNGLGGGPAIKDIRDGLAGNSQTGPDASGYYTATLGAIVPDNAKMVTAAVGVAYQGFVQLNLPQYPNGIRLREAKFAVKTADGHTARRSIISADKCNSCHGQLGVSPSFHSGARNNGEGCAACHVPNKYTGHTGAAYNFGGGWSVSAKNLVHGIHGSSKREKAYSYEATAANPTGFQDVGYPGVLKNCEQCHVPGSYDFSAATNSAAVPNLLWTTEAGSDMSNPTNAASIGLSPWITTLGRGQTDYRTDNLVSSPIASACFGCHDSNAALGHMKSNGGSIYASVSAVSTGGARPAMGTTTGFSFTQVETCLVCHGSGRVADIKAAHGK